MKKDFSSEQEQMIKEQLEKRDIVDKRVLKAMKQVPREEFVLSSNKKLAYTDQPLSIGESQTISQPYIVALMTQLLKLKGGEKVLEIGTGSGYQTAILSYLVKEVYSIERHYQLLAKAKMVFKKLGIKNIRVKEGDGARGWQEKAPFEAIIVTAAAKKVPEDLIKQLAEKGRLVIPVNKKHWGQELIRLTKKGKKLEKENFGGCAFVPLVTQN